MRAITIHQPWAELIVRGEKDVENRSWRTLHRGPLLIHAGPGRPGVIAGARRPDDAERSAIIGVVEVIDCTQERTSTWHEPGSWGWYLARAKRFPKPIPMKGRRGLFEVPDRRIASQLGTWKRQRAPRRR